MTSLPDIPFTRLALQMTAESTIRLPRFPGSVFRGGFGVSLRRICCALRNQDCRDCMLRGSCLYASVFESSPEGDSGNGYQLSDYPRPFVIEPPFPIDGPISPGESFTFHLTLLGRLIDQLPYFAYAFYQLGKSGLGAGRGKFRIDKVTGAVGAETALVVDGPSERFVGPAPVHSLADLSGNGESPRRISLTFWTPTRIKARNQLTKKISFDLLLKNLLRRASLLAQICTGAAWEIDYRGLIRQAEAIECSRSTLYWLDWKRYSARQKADMRLGGFMGTVSFDGNLAPFLPILRMGEYIHIGKACTFGLGKYEITEGPS